MESEMRLSGNTILITGGSAGIGLALAKKFVELGNKVLVTGRTESKLQKAKEEVPELETFVCDVSHPTAIQTLANQVRESHPGLNVLINNAGIFIARNITSAANDLDELVKEIDINFSGTVWTTSCFVDIIKKNKGTIMNVSSGLAFVPLQSAPIYCATKAALHSYSTSLRYQLAEYGVEVIELAPPAVKTDLTADLPEDGEFKMLTTAELVKSTIDGIKAGKKEIRPGQANQLKFMSRLAPGFIEDQIWKGSKFLLPKPD